MRHFTQIRDQLEQDLDWEDHAVKVFQIDLDCDESVVRRMMEILVADEVARAAKYRLGSDKRRYVLTRGFLRILLSGYLGVSPKDVKISYSQYGKPFIEEPHAALHFNVSKSGEMALIAFSQSYPVGIDIEFVSDRIDAFAIAKRVFPSEECELLRSKRSVSLMAAFYDLWTRREAFVKALGEGITQMKRRACSLVGSDGFFTPMTIARSDLGGECSLVSLPVNMHYRAALATKGIMGNVSRFAIDRPPTNIHAMLDMMNWQ